MKRKYERRITNHQSRATNHESRRKGSALILTVVLTTLLATLGVLFVLLSRIDKIAASATSENRQLNFAIDTVVAKISQELVLDVPGVAGQEYHDYPGPEDRWLASLEPNDNRMWPQISDVYNKLAPNLQLQAGIIPDYQNPGEVGNGLPADSDGDGVADSKWILLSPDITSSKGKPIYAAIRIVDNGGMLNVNTAYKFDPNETDPNLIDGSSQRQINLMALAGRPPLPSWPVGTPYTSQEENLLLYERDRYGIGAGLNDYENFVIWSYGGLAKPYTPFDISDELELRYRFLLNHEDIDTRLEPWGGEFRDTILSTPVTTGGQELNKWFKRAHFDPSILDMNDPKDPNYYAYRHIATTYNMDRVINPAGKKMVNVNMADANSIYDALRNVLPDVLAAQIAVNIKDYRDLDSDVTTYGGYYGFETPCIYISELAHNLVPPSGPTDSNHHSYAIELYKPYFEDGDPNAAWILRVDGRDTPVTWSGTRRFHVIRFEDPNAQLPVNFNDPNEPIGPNPFGYNPGSYARTPQDDVNGIAFNANNIIELRRPVFGGYIAVDSRQVPGWLVSGQGAKSFQRDITRHKCIRRLWDSATRLSTLGSSNTYKNGDSIFIQAHPTNKPFTNIGEIGMVFRENVYGRVWQATDTENAVRLNLADATFQQIFNYLTVIDPAAHGQPLEEKRIKGRININTAPWFVIAQLPWIQPPLPGKEFMIAQAIVGYRDTIAKGFKSIGELMQIPEMDYYAADPSEQGDLGPSPGRPVVPDLTPSDGAADDFEERDAIFSRISNLVTVRSDVFTAYILVRIGVDGPQKRVIAILDRSQVYSHDGKVKIIAIQPVPDPR